MSKQWKWLHDKGLSIKKRDKAERRELKSEEELIDYEQDYYERDEDGGTDM